MKTFEKFLRAAEQKAFSPEHRQRIAFNMAKYDAQVEQGKTQFENLEKARRLAKNVKWLAMENLPKLLQEFEEKFTARGGKVIWAEDATQARIAIRQIIAKKNAQRVVKSKSMMTEELELNAFLQDMGVEVLETDLGEYIVQQRGEKPYHIVTPAMHLSKGDIAAFFHQKFGTPADATPEFLTAFVRERLRESFRTADIGITGANFIIANTGSILITENEGNARLTTALPRTHIAVVGIEKVLPSLKHLDLFLPLLATHGTGQRLTTYNTILSAPRRPHETDGPEEMYVILVDNGRSAIFADPVQRESLYCIRCGACLNGCPVYRMVGGHTYDTPYSGPIGAVLMPNLEARTHHAHLSNASSLCGKCTEVCPVKIDLHNLLLDNRRQEEAAGLKPADETRLWRRWRWLMLRRWALNVPRFAKVWVAKRYLAPIWGQRREFPEFPQMTFNQLWKKGLV